MRCLAETLVKLFVSRHKVDHLGAELERRSGLHDESSEMERRAPKLQNASFDRGFECCEMILCSC